jgi:hypothetical protein
VAAMGCCSHPHQRRPPRLPPPWGTSLGTTASGSGGGGTIDTTITTTTATIRPRPRRPRRQRRSMTLRTWYVHTYVRVCLPACVGVTE